MQEILVLIVVLSAIAFLGHKAYKSLFSKKSNCEVNCGCETSKGSPVLERLKKKG